MRRNFTPTVTSFDVLKRMFKQGAGVNKRDKSDGSTVLHQAAKAGSRVLVWILLKQGADVNARDGFGRTALHLASESRQRSSQGVVELLIEKGAEINFQNNVGETALHLACWAMDRALVDTLLKNRADVGLAEKNGMTPLHVVAHSSTDEKDIANALLECSANVNAVDLIGRSPLHWACFFERKRIVFQILNKSADVNLKDYRGDTPLHLSCLSYGVEISDMLIKKGADISSTNRKGRTALHMAVLQGSVSVLDVLFDNGADVNAKDVSGDTPLHLAVSWVSRDLFLKGNEMTDVFRKLLNRGAAIDVKNLLQKTPYDNMVDFEEKFCSIYEFENTRYKDNLRKLTDIFIDHAIKLKTAKLQVEVDIRPRLGSVKYVILQTMCVQELQRLKSITVVEGLSLYNVFSDFKKPGFLLYEKNFEDYLSSSHLTKSFPIYGPLLRTIFQRAKLQPQTIQSSEEQPKNDITDKPGDISVLK